MGTKATVEVVGARELRAAMVEAGADLQDMKEVHAAVAGIVATAARVTAPIRTGALAASVRAGATERAAVVRAGSSKVPYAQPIHWGWFRRHIKANPFMSRAAQESESVWIQKYEQAVADIIDNISGSTPQ